MRIREWLANPTDFEAGRILFERYGKFPALKKQFARGRLKNKLIYELGKLVGADEQIEKNKIAETGEIANIKFDSLPPADNNLKVSVPNPDSEQTQDVESTDHSAIKPLYDQRTMLHNQLSVMETDEQRLAAAEQIELLTDKIENILSPTEKKETVVEIPAAPLTATGKMKRLQNLKTYISKHKSNKKKAEDVKKWIEEKDVLEKELNEA